MATAETVPHDAYPAGAEREHHRQNGPSSRPSCRGICRIRKARAAEKATTKSLAGRKAAEADCPTTGQALSSRGSVVTVLDTSLLAFEDRSACECARWREADEQPTAATSGNDGRSPARPRRRPRSGLPLCRRALGASGLLTCRSRPGDPCPRPPGEPRRPASGGTGALRCPRLRRRGRGDGRLGQDPLLRAHGRLARLALRGAAAGSVCSKATTAPTSSRSEPGSRSGSSCFVPAIRTASRPAAPAHGSGAGTGLAWSAAPGATRCRRRRGGSCTCASFKSPSGNIICALGDSGYTRCFSRNRPPFGNAQLRRHGQDLQRPRLFWK